MFPGQQGGPLEHVIAAKAVALRIAASEGFRERQRRTLEGAAALARGAAGGRQRRQRADRRHRRAPDPRRPARERAQRPGRRGSPARDPHHGQPQRGAVRPAPAARHLRAADRLARADDARPGPRGLPRDRRDHRRGARPAVRGAPRASSRLASSRSSSATPSTPSWRTAPPPDTMLAAARSLRPLRKVDRRGSRLALAGRCVARARRRTAAPAPRCRGSRSRRCRGTLDASPTTQISFLGVPAGDISRISVRGSRSGGHRGKLEPYATGTGASYVLLRPFTPTETGHRQRDRDGRRALARDRHDASRSVRCTSAAALGSTVLARPTARPAAGGADGVQSSFLERTGAAPADDHRHRRPPRTPALGDIFLTPVDGGPQAGAMIVNPAGQLVWFSPRRPARRPPTCACSTTSGRPC